MKHFNFHTLLVSLCAFLMTNSAFAGPRVDVVIDPAAPKLERFAADELAGQFKKIFDADVHIGETVPADATHVIILGSPATNPAVSAVGELFPKLTDQGHVLRSVKSAKVPTLLVGGGSPVATLWAAYELGHHFGIRYMLFGDMFPVVTPELKLDGIDTVLEPSLRLRAWQTLGEGPLSPVSWGLVEQQRVIRQLAKLKFNRVIVSVQAGQPFVDFELQGIHKKTGVLWKGNRFPVDGDTAGRTAFRGAKTFENPDFFGKQTYEEHVATGVELVRGMIDTAHELGMSAALQIAPLEFPIEFRTVLPGSTAVISAYTLATGPGAEQSEKYPELLRLAKAQLRAYLATYPTIDTLYLSIPILSSWNTTYESAWQQLDARTGIGKETTLEQLATTVRDLQTNHLLQSNLVALEFVHTLLSDRDLLRAAAGRPVPVVIEGVEKSLFPVLDKAVPPNAGVLHYFGLPLRAVLKRDDIFTTVPAKTIDNSLRLCFTNGLLPRISHSELHEVIQKLKARQWEGFVAQFGDIGIMDLNAYYLSRASVEATMTPTLAAAEMMTPVCGEGVVDRVLKAFDLIQAATVLTESKHFTFEIPPPILGEVHAPEYSIREDASWWGDVRTSYLNAMNEMYRANTRAREGGRQFTLYFARRFEFAFEYMNCVQAIHKAGIAKAKGDKETQIAELEKAIESVHAACNAMAAVARSNSDRGIIAVMNEYAYRPLKRELEAVEKAAAEK